MAARRPRRAEKAMRCDADVFVRLLTGAGPLLPPKYGVQRLVEQSGEERRRLSDVRVRVCSLFPFHSHAAVVIVPCGTKRGPSCENQQF